MPTMGPPYFPPERRVDCVCGYWGLARTQIFAQHLVGKRPVSPAYDQAWG